MDSEMLTIQIEYRHSREAVARVQNLIDHVVLHDPNWIGIKYAIERGDYTQIDGGDSINAAALYIRVKQALDGATLV